MPWVDSHTKSGPDQERKWVQEVEHKKWIKITIFGSFSDKKKAEMEWKSIP